MSGYSDPIAAGTGELIRRELKSLGFDPGVFGWQITRAGDAEFNSLVARGTIIVGPDGSPQVIIDQEGLPFPKGFIDFPTNGPGESEAARIASELISGGTSNEVESISITAGKTAGDPVFDTFIALFSADVDGTQRPTITFGIGGGAFVEITEAGLNVFVGDLTLDSELVLVDGAWTTLTLGAGWSGTVQYQLRSPDLVALRGEASHAGAPSGTTVLQMPVGVRPAVTQRFVIAASAAAGQGAIRLDIAATTGVCAINWGGGGNTALASLNGVEFRLDSGFS